MEMNEQFTIALIVTNHYGVLNRITGLYNKRGYNIDSLTVGETENPEYSRMTIVSRGDDNIRTQMLRQLNKLYDVQAATSIDSNDAIFVDHLLIKLVTGKVSYSVITHLINEYGGKILNIGDSYITADITGTPERIREFVKKCKPIGIHELCRSGTLALSSDSTNILKLNSGEVMDNGEDVL